MQGSKDRILTTHVGSLVRTKEIVECQIRKYLGERVDPDEYARAVKDGVAQVVRRQADVGVDVIDDGEYGKLNWIAYLGERMQGLEKSEAKLSTDDAAGFWPEQELYNEFYQIYHRHESTQWLPAAPSLARYDGNQTTDYQNLVCRGRLRYDPTALHRDISNFKSALKNVAVAEAFMPVVAPGSIDRGL